MDNLTLALRQLDQALDKLGQILQTEYQLLAAMPLQPVALQCVTHDKSQQLSAVAHYDALRQQAEVDSGFLAPYACHPDLDNLWAQIQTRTLDLYEQNRRNRVSLESQIAHIHSLSAAIKALAPQQMFYCADGASHYGMRLQNLDINA
ncbi:flagella synthesis protein FlgN [Sodalis-like endosymbiont of Proechinophthirus fluctus]|uniref:flagella synthesis protein FlgN n=1 Tax=Sodalis-like endosymbiont of Proechinophthirus fluctus TaxID=1462730 RepID=UPI00164FDEDE|nr:flagellar export chaperone FlgN [Sodalis-like endosymbiont of Proechinophthirus fluctus]